MRESLTIVAEEGLVSLSCSGDISRLLLALKLQKSAHIKRKPLLFMNILKIMTASMSGTFRGRNRGTNLQESLWAKHKRLSEDLWKGLRKMGLEPFVEDPDDRLCTVNTIKVPTFIPRPRPNCGNPLDGSSID